MILSPNNISHVLTNITSLCQFHVWIFLTGVLYSRLSSIRNYVPYNRRVSVQFCLWIILFHTPPPPPPDHHLHTFNSLTLTIKHNNLANFWNDIFNFLLNFDIFYVFWNRRSIFRRRLWYGMFYMSRCSLVCIKVCIDSM